MSYEYKSTSYKLKSTSYEFKFSSHELKSTSNEFKSNIEKKVMVQNIKFYELQEISTSLTLC